MIFFFFKFCIPCLASEFADDKPLSAFTKSILELIHVLQSESKLTIDWFNNNKRILNPDKFQSVLLDKTNKIT